MTASTPGGRPLVLRNVTVVDTRDGALAPGVDVGIADRLIREITTSDRDAATAAPAMDAEVVDGSGRYSTSPTWPASRTGSGPAHPAT
jgi:N-acyl-D-aspartate/D-glutamate deacylase